MMTQPDECVHWWVIESPDGRHLLPGKCKKCGAERDDFPATSDDDNMHRWHPHVPGMQREPVYYIFED